MKRPLALTAAFLAAAFGGLQSMATPPKAQVATGGGTSRIAPEAALAGLRFENISISVADLARTSAWYQDALGFEVARTGEFSDVGARFVFLKGHGMQVELISAGRASMPETQIRPPDHLKTTGYKTLVLNTPNLSGLSEHLERKGVRIIWRERNLADGLSSTMVSDNEGNLINIFASQSVE